VHFTMLFEVDTLSAFICVHLRLIIKCCPDPTPSSPLPPPGLHHSPALPFLNSTDLTSLALQTGCGFSCAERGSGSSVRRVPILNVIPAAPFRLHSAWCPSRSAPPAFVGMGLAGAFRLFRRFKGM